MRKSKKRVIAIITCCFVLATFCVGVFADEGIDPNMSRIGTVLTSEPYDLGDLYVHFDSTGQRFDINPGYYILKVDYISNLGTIFVSYIEESGGEYFVVFNSNNILNIRYNNNFTDNSDFVVIDEFGTYYIYIYIADNESTVKLWSSASYNSEYIDVSLYQISNRSVIDSVYANSQDVNSSIVSVINEATNVITTNNVVMMFCILIPVISFGAGILIRLRKRA